MTEHQTSIEAYPLCWPQGRKRASWRERSAFRVALGKARDEIRREVSLLAGKANLVISSNLALRQDGLPYANQRQPEDPGVAVYFTYKKRQMCFACDRWQKVEDNMHAIGLTIAALRGVARWGTGDMMEAAFTGFAALPPPGQTAVAGWRELFGFGSLTPTRADIDAVYRAMRSRHHPDKGGRSEDFDAVQKAYEQACRELGA